MVFSVRRRRPSLLGLLTAAVLLLGQAAGVVHMAAVQHQRCLEHGELVHAAVRPNRADALADRPTGMVAGDDEADRHEHCLAAGCSRQGPAASLSSSGQTIDGARVHVLPSARDLAVTAPPLRFAPKTSPPARA
jgi:hypothetical protein